MLPLEDREVPARVLMFPRLISHWSFIVVAPAEQIKPIMRPQCLATITRKILFSSKSLGRNRATGGQIHCNSYAGFILLPTALLMPQGEAGSCTGKCIHALRSKQPLSPSKNSILSTPQLNLCTVKCRFQGQTHTQEDLSTQHCCNGVDIWDAPKTSDQPLP